MDRLPIEMKMRSKLCFLLHCFVLLFLSYLNSYVCSGVNNLTIGQSISINQTIISHGGLFEFGFFQSGKSSDYAPYSLGIWYKNISPQTLVWVAQRSEATIFSFPKSSSLEFSQDGLLIIKDKENDPYPYELISSAAQVALLLDNGNLVLRNGSDSNSSTIWQSFDHPSNTWLPGSKLTTQSPITLGVNSDTYRTLLLSLVPNTTLSTLVFQYDWDGRSHTYWTWSWNGNNFGSVDKNLTKYIKFSFVSNSNESYFSYSAYNPSIPTRLVLNSLGEMELLMWSASLQNWNSVTVGSYLCGANSWKQYGKYTCKCLTGFELATLRLSNTSSAPVFCIREEELKCGYKESDAFYVVSNIKLPEDYVSIQLWNIDQCKSACLIDCYCTAYLFRNICFIWRDNLVSLVQVSPNDDSGNDLHIRAAVSESKHFTTEKPKARTTMVIASIATITFVCIIFFVSWWKCQRRKSSMSLDTLVSYRYSDLRRATKNFSEELGKGGFGSVFRGTMSDLSVIAVKKLECFAGEKQFRSEVNTIGMIHHVNLIRLRGFCAEGNKRLLVYDYMPNGSLSSNLFKRDSKILDWKTRYQIILGIARGLQYLHEKCRNCIIHCDIKPENILLDAGFNAIVADFGLAKMLGRDFTHALTTMRGTRGYLAPEWISGVPITPKVDVYSYGMMLFEIISGRRNLDTVDNDMVRYFPALVASKTNMGEELICLLDPRLEGKADVREVTRACKLACWCIQDDENDRPSMGYIVSVLEGFSELGISPVPSFLQVILRDGPNTMDTIRSHSSSSLHDKSINSWTSSVP